MSDAVDAQRARTSANLAAARTRYTELATWTEIVEVLLAADWSREAVLLFGASPNGRIEGGARPFDVLASDPEAALSAARHSAAGPP